MSDSVRPHRQQPNRLPAPGILQARTLEWVAISFSNAWKWKVKVKSLSCVRILATNGLQPTRLLRPWDFPGKSTGVGCHCLLRLKDLEARNPTSRWGQVLFLLRPHFLAHRQFLAVCLCLVAKLCSTVCDLMNCSTPGCLVLCYHSSSFPLSQWRYLTILSSVALFFFGLQSFPTSRSLPMSQLFASGGWSFGASASASVFPRNIQGYFL